MEGYAKNEQYYLLKNILEDFRYVDWRDPTKDLKNYMPNATFPFSALPKATMRQVTEEEYAAIINPPENHSIFKTYPPPSVLTKLTVVKNGSKYGDGEFFTNGMVIVHFENNSKTLFSPYMLNCPKHDYVQVTQYETIEGVPKAFPYSGYRVYLCKVCGHWRDSDSSG